MSNDLTHTPPVTPEPRSPGDAGPTIGQWYWVKGKKEKRWLGCVMDVGSNYILIESPHYEYNSYHSHRIHVDDFGEMLTFASDAAAYIASQQAQHQQRISELMGEVQALTARLGVMPSDKLTAPTIAVPADKLLNVTAYTPGDFKQFYADPRTRANYLQWAPLLLAAEDYHAGKLKK